MSSLQWSSPKGLILFSSERQPSPSVTDLIKVNQNRFCSKICQINTFNAGLCFSCPVETCHSWLLCEDTTQQVQVKQWIGTESKCVCVCVYIVKIIPFYTSSVKVGEPYPLTCQVSLTTPSRFIDFSIGGDMRHQTRWEQCIQVTTRNWTLSFCCIIRDLKDVKLNVTGTNTDYLWKHTKRMQPPLSLSVHQAPQRYSRYWTLSGGTAQVSRSH